MLFGGDGDRGSVYTRRLQLCPPRRRDVAALDEAIQETLPELIRWLPWARAAHTRADSRHYVRSARTARLRRTALEFLISDRESRRLLGVASLHRIDWQRRSAGVGYWVRRADWGRGIATEAARELALEGFRAYGLNRLELQIAVDNKASQRVADKLGFHREGVARGAEFVNGRYLDHIQYSLLRSDVELDLPPAPFGRIA